MEDAVIFLMCFGDIAVILVGIFAVFTLSWSRGSGGCLCCSHCTRPPSLHLLRLIVYIYLPTPYLWKILACHQLLTGNWSQVKASTYLFVSKLVPGRQAEDPSSLLHARLESLAILQRCSIEMLLQKVVS